MPLAIDGWQQPYRRCEEGRCLVGGLSLKSDCGRRVRQPLLEVVGLATPS
jgi:hypothetical protein